MKLAVAPPPVATAVAPAYRIRLARSTADLRDAQRLRYEVFNVELGEGLAASHATGLDQDAFDEYCDHLLVEDASKGRIVGTYRLQTGQLAAAQLGYYCEQEFDFAPFEPLRCELVELGRACVHKDHRHIGVLNLLWRGIARYAVDRRARYLVGCSSLTSQDPGVGAATYAAFARSGVLAPPEHRTLPTAAYACALDHLAEHCTPPPRLLRAYLAMGARICGPPALDCEFRTIDFLTLLDLENLPAAARGHFGI